jgi:hypothetical protein
VGWIEVNPGQYRLVWGSIGRMSAAAREREDGRLTLTSVDVCDGDLVRLARTGDTAAFRLLVERHRAMALARAARLCAHPDDADDIVQEAFLQAFVALDWLRDVDRFGAWLAGPIVGTGVLRCAYRCRAVVARCPRRAPAGRVAAGRGTTTQWEAATRPLAGPVLRTG